MLKEQSAEREEQRVNSLSLMVIEPFVVKPAAELAERKGLRAER